MHAESETLTLQQQAAVIETMIHRAEADRDFWRQAGQTEKYLESYCLVMALERQLEHLDRVTH